MIQLLEQIAKEQCEIKPRADIQDKFRHKTPECCGTIVKALKEKRTEFHTCKLEKKEVIKWY
jgi:hypothetical protein